nr:uncharacterized protein LOC102147882 [Equus caballus]
MSDIEKGSPDLGGQNRARGGVGQDPRSTESAELGAEVARAAYPGDFQAIVQAHVEEEVWLDIPEVIIENWDVQQVEEEWVPGEEEAVGEEEDEQEEGEAEEGGEEEKKRSRKKATSKSVRIMWTKRKRRMSPYHSSLKKWLNISMATLRRRPRKREVRKRMNVKNQKKDSKWTWTAQRAAPENPGINV